MKKSPKKEKKEKFKQKRKIDLTNGKKMCII